MTETRRSDQTSDFFSVFFFLNHEAQTSAQSGTHPLKLTHSVNSGYVWLLLTTTGEEHDNLFRRVCLPSASNYGRMREAGAGFVLKVNMLYTEPHPALERFPPSTALTSGYVSSDEVCTHK